MGGAELGIHELYDRIGRDHEVVIVAPRPGDLDPGVEIDHVSSHYSVERLLPELDRGPALLRKGVRRTPAAYLAELERVSRRFRPDVINPHFLMRQSGAAVAVSRQLGVPVAMSLVGRSDVIHRQPAWRRSWSRWVLSRVDAVFANSAYYLQGEPPSARVHVVPYGVELDAYSPTARSEAVREKYGLSKDDVGVLAVQRLQPVKRVDALIHATRIAVQQDPRIKLIVAGKGSEAERLKALAGDLGIADNVRFAGYVAEEDLPGLYASADLFAFHSLHETFGVVFAQAMASGLPVVAAATSCIPEVVHPSNGALIPPFDVAAMAEEWLRLAADASRRREIGAANRRRAEREFGWDDIADEYVRVMGRLSR